MFSPYDTTGDKIVKVITIGGLFLLFCVGVYLLVLLGETNPDILEAIP